MSLPGAATMLFHVGFRFIGGLWSSELRKGSFLLVESLESLGTLNSLESLENGRILLCFPQSGRSLASLVKFDDDICGGVLWKMLLSIFPSKRSSKISFQTSPEVRHQFHRKLRQLHSGNRWRLIFCLFVHMYRAMCCRMGYRTEMFV